MSKRVWFAITADQRRSRTSDDQVPPALDRLSALPDFELGFERTAGDEIQGLTSDARACVDAVVELTRLGGFRIGVGVGDVELPLPTSTRAARGPAYVFAREAVAQHGALLALRADDLEKARLAETALLALVHTVARRSPEGWQVIDLVNQGLTGAAAARKLGISASAVSQRLSAAEHSLGDRLRDLACHLLNNHQSGA